MDLAAADAATIARAFSNRSSIPPFTDTRPDFDLAYAYGVGEALAEARMAEGGKPVGWKVGFTNRAIWEEYGVHAPIFGRMYDRTVTATTGPATLAIGHLVEPRIEPEIVLRFRRAPTVDMDETALIGCLDAIAHGFELVQSPFPEWRFKAPDTVACGALHGALVVGKWTPLPGWRTPEEWLALLTRFSVTLAKDGTEVDHGVASNVLGGPLSACLHFMRDAAARGLPAIGPGDIVTTGTLTRAFPIAAGERWTTRIDGLVVADMDLTVER
jgi:2-oxo-3-hexenedioate decarboxylase